MNDLKSSFIREDLPVNGISPITEIIDEIRQGRMVVLVDEEALC